jgi:hypothetical protein
VPSLVIVFDTGGGQRHFPTIARTVGQTYDPGGRAYALVEIGDPNAIDVYLRSEDAFVALEEILGEEPDWTGLLSVAPIELDERDISAN